MRPVAPSRSGRRSFPAYTLIDLVITVAIVAIMAAIALPRYGRSATRYRADMAARRIRSDLELLRVRARAQGTDESGYFHVDGDYVQYWSDPDLDNAGKEYCVYLNQEPYRADIVEVNFDDGLEIRARYGNYGHPHWGGYVIIRVGDEKRKIVVDPDTGEATIE